LLAGCATGSYYIDDDYNSGKRAQERGNYKEAARYYQQYVADNPDSTMTEVAMYYLAECYQEMGDNQKAKDTYGKLVAKYKSGFWADSAKKELKELN
jgi:TolA-binding protein